VNAAPTSTQPEAADGPAPPDSRRRRRPRRRTVVLVVLVVGAGAGLAIVNALDGGSAAQNPQKVAPTGVATIKRGRLSARTSVGGTLSYAGNYTVFNHASGTFTRLPRTGGGYRQGQVLYRVDGKPVILLKGSGPLYRTLSEGMRGADVRQLNAALVALRYAGSELNPKSRYFGWATTDALLELQDKLGMKEDGKLGRDEAVFLPSDKIRVSRVTAATGGSAGSGTEVFRATSTDRLVTVAVDATAQSPVKAGDKVTITLPDLETTPGVVRSVGTEVKKSSSQATVNVRIEPTKPSDTGRLDKAPVSVSIVTERVDDVLSVPVNALLALLGGGFGVEVVGAGGVRRLVPVTVGLFDNTAGVVEISGTGLAAGQRVVVPAS
jgi:HlyD family secretion protein/putative peptidoglycan binding protein